MVCALTFDDGPDGRWTPQVLDLLWDAQAHATFFVLGCKVAGNEALLRRMVDEGHEVGNHGWNHPHLPHLSIGRVEDEIDETTLAIEDAIGQQIKLWRAPFLATTDEINAVVLGGWHLRHVAADVIPADWALSDPQQIAQNVLSELKDGDIVLLHDGVPPDGGTGTQDRQPTVDAVALLLDTPGVSWVSVSELG